MKKVKIVMAFLLILTILIAGCLGGGENEEIKPPEYVETKGTTGAEGSQSTDVTYEPETMTETVNLPIPADNITKLSFVITVNDGTEENSDDGTNPDEVSGDLEGAGGYNETLKQGQTPYQDTITIKAQEGQNLPPSWTLYLNVVCHAGEDQWPGPYIWRAPHDNGFSYNVTLTYVYLTPVET